MKRPAFCMFCGQDYMVEGLDYCDVATPITGPCCMDTPQAKRLRDLAASLGVPA